MHQFLRFNVNERVQKLITEDINRTKSDPFFGDAHTAGIKHTKRGLGHLPKYIFHHDMHDHESG